MTGWLRLPAPGSSRCWSSSKRLGGPWRLDRRLLLDEENLSARVDFANEAHQARFDELAGAEQLARDYTGPLEPGWDWGYDRRWTYLPWWLDVMIRPRAHRFCTCIPVSDLPEVLHRVCYALARAPRPKGMGVAGDQHNGDPRTSGPGFAVIMEPPRLTEPLHWRAPRRVFVNSVADLSDQQMIWKESFRR
jgi:hypothetical protein